MEYWRNAGTRAFWEEWIRECVPSIADDAEAIDWFTKLARGTIGLGGSLSEYVQYQSTDVRGILPAIRVPTLVLFKPENDTQAPEAGPHLASKIAGAKLVALPGADYLPWFDEPDALLDEVEEFLTGVRPVPEVDRVLATVLFTDIVDSTKRAAEIGDQKWKQLLAAHHERIAGGDRPSSRPRGRHDGRRVLRDVRRSGSCRPMRASDRGIGPWVGDRGPSGSAHGRGGARR